MSNIIPGVAFDLTWRVRIIASALPKTSGTLYAYVRRMSDGYWLNANASWTVGVPTGAALPVATHLAQGLWRLTLALGTTALLTTGDALLGLLSDSETPASATVDCAEIEWAVDASVAQATALVFDAVESQRGHHTAQKLSAIYVGPVLGNDTTGNGSRALPYKTVTKALSVVVDGTHTPIYVLADQASGPTVLLENITWNKRYTFLRGPGRDLIIRGVTSNTPTITVTAAGAEFSGFQLESAATGSNAAGVQANGTDFTALRHVFINATQGAGVELVNCSNARVNDCTFQGTGVSASGHGLSMACSGTGNSNHNRIEGNKFYDVLGDAIRLTKAGSGSNLNNCVTGNSIHGSTGIGVSVGAGVVDTQIHANHFGGGNVGGDIVDAGTGTAAMNNEQWTTAANVSGAVWNKAIASHLATAGSFAEALAVIRGLLNYNSVLDQTTYSSRGLLTSGRMRVFPTPADAVAGTNAITTLTIVGVAEASPDDHLGLSLRVTSP